MVEIAKFQIEFEISEFMKPILIICWSELFIAVG